MDVAKRLFVDPSAEFTLERVAAQSDVSVQTVLRAFGTKEAMILAAHLARKRKLVLTAVLAADSGEAVIPINW